MHFWRSLVRRRLRSCLWFYAIGNLPLATAMTLNYMSSVWMALFLIGGAVARVGPAARASTAGWSRPCCSASPASRWCCGRRSRSTQLWPGLMGLLSGMLAAMAYLQVTALGRAGEPEYRVVFYFSIGGMAAGALTMLWTGAARAHAATGAAAAARRRRARHASRS